MEILLISKLNDACASIPDIEKRSECIKSQRIESREVEHRTNLQIPYQIYSKPNDNPSILTSPLNESFTGTTFPPVGWSVYNQDNGTQTWVRYTTNCRTAPACASVLYEGSALANNDWLVTPALIIQNASLTNPQIRFAYRTSTTTNINTGDSLNLEISTDNGATWTKIWQWNGVGSTTPVWVSLPIPQNLTHIRFAFYDNKSTADASPNYFNIDSLSITDGSYTFLLESWTASTIFLSAGYDTTTSTTTRRWQRRTSACPFTEATTACAGFAYTETGTTTGYAYLSSPRIYISPSIIGFWYLSQSTAYVDSFDVYIIKWNNQANPPTPSDFISSGVRIDTKYPRTGTTGTPYIYTAYDLRGPVNAIVNDTVYVAIRYKALNAWRLYADDFTTVGAVLRDLPPSITLLKGAVYHFYNGIPDTVRIIASDPDNLPNVSCQVGYRYVINSNQEGNSPSGAFTEYNMTLSDASPNVYPDTFIYIIPHTDRGLRGNYYIKCTDASNLVSYIPTGAPNNNWYIYNIMPSGKFAQKHEFVDEVRIRLAFYRNNIDLQPDLLLLADSLVWLDSLRLWDRIYWHQNSTSALRRNKIRAYLDLGTCSNRKSLVLFGNDFGYLHDREGATDRDTIFTRNYLHFRYVSDDWTNASDVSDTILGITNRPIFGDMTYQIYTNDVYPDDIRVHPAGDENTSVAILYVKNGDSTNAYPNNPSIASVFYNGLGYYSIFGSFAINYVATYDVNGQERVDTLFRRIHNFIPVSTCINEVEAYNHSYNLAVDGSTPDNLSAEVRVNDPNISNPSDVRVYGYYRPFGVGSWTKVQATYVLSNANGHIFRIQIPVNEPNTHKRDSFEVYFTAHKLNYGVYGPANTSNTAKVVYEYDVLNAPLNFNVSYRDLDSVVLVWNPPALLKKNDNQILAFQSYQIEFSPDNNNWTLLTTIPNVNTTTYTHIFSPDSEYIKYYRIRANYTAGSSPYVSTYTIYDIRPPRKLYADTFNFNIVGPNLNTQVKAVFQDLTPIQYDTIYYRTLLNPWSSKTKDNVINPDTFVYSLNISGLSANDTLFFYFKVADNSNNVRITDTTKIPIQVVSIVDIPKKFDITYTNGVITFALPKEAKISLEVYNTSGRLVFGINSNYRSGYIRFDLNSLPKGPYLIRAKTDNLSKEFKTIIIK